MSLGDELRELLKRLRLAGVLDSLEARLLQAAEDRLEPQEFLYRLLSDEVARRDRRQLELRLRRASFEQEKVLEDFDWSFNPRVPRGRVLELATCRFVAEKRDVVFVGATGVGKSHLAQALGHQACRAGHSVRYVAAADMLKELRAARADESYERALRGLVRPDLLIVDDLGLRPLRGDEPQDVYEVIRQRYERGSTIWTSNRALEEWPGLFLDPLLGSAAVDRLLHHADVLVLEGDTGRNPPPGKARPRAGVPPSQPSSPVGSEREEVAP
ncbi:MAG: IS21-like element helper ATPase IstB [Planctomycetes bacterium]|nr:IS21-like element helper ATPase IstB [Planctomycetota bacterium]